MDWIDSVSSWIDMASKEVIRLNNELWRLELLVLFVYIWLIILTIHICRPKRKEENHEK